MYLLKKITLSLLISVIVSILFMGCKSPEQKSDNTTNIENFKNEFINSYWQIHPVEAIYSGYHENDGTLAIYDSVFFNNAISKLNELNEKLATFDVEHMATSDKIDFYMMRDRIEADLWYINRFREYEWNPAYFNIGGEFAEILNSKTSSLDEKLKTCLSRLKGVDQYYITAQSSIKSPVKEHTELAITQTNGALPVFESMLMDSIQQSSLSEQDKNMLIEANNAAIESIKGYLDYLNRLYSQIESDTSQKFRIGRELYDQKFNYDIRSGYTAEQIFDIAQKRKSEVQSQMAEISRGLWQKYFNNEPMPDDDNQVIKRVINKIALNHVHRDSFQFYINKQIADLVQFVKDHNLLYLDPSKPLVVRQTPGYMEGSGAGASISAPGPYDKGGNTYYNVSPLTGYSDEQAESYLREYNNYTLQILNIHEAIPGHYAQLVYSNQAGLIKSILGNGAMVEGWAVYSERMMLEEGYGDNQPEMWLMYYKWHLRSVCNTILDYSVHVNGMTKEQAINFLTNEAFQEQAEAEGKWRRVKLSQVQLCSYFTGYSEIYALREDIKARQGDIFNLKAFHEQFLSYGSAPVKYIRKLMLDDEANQPASGN